MSKNFNDGSNFNEPDFYKFIEDKKKTGEGALKRINYYINNMP